MTALILKNIVTCSVEDQEKIREIRNKDSIRKYMYTDHMISEGEHANWLAMLETNETRLAFIVYNDEGAVLGLASFDTINREEGSASWAFYLDDIIRGGGVGSTLEYGMITYAFDDLKIEKLNCEVLEWNAGVIRLHRKFGFVDRTDGGKTEIEKNEEIVKVIPLQLTRDEWEAHKVEMNTKYSGLFESTAVQFEG